VNLIQGRIGGVCIAIGAFGLAQFAWLLRLPSMF
jgi:hypothetical protein